MGIPVGSLQESQPVHNSVNNETVAINNILPYQTCGGVTIVFLYIRLSGIAILVHLTVTRNKNHNCYHSAEY